MPERFRDTGSTGLSRSALFKRLSELLLPQPIANGIVSEKIERLLILPVGDFSTVPFYALPIDGKQLIDLVAIVIVPNVDSLEAALERRAQLRRFRASSGKLIVGDPVGLAERLPPLPGAREEARAVDQLTSFMDGPLLTGQVDWRRVEDGIGRPDLGLIYLATHGFSDPVDPLDKSFLVLSDARLTARQIAKSSTHRSVLPLVVMSACQSGLGKTFEGGTFGLARAWFKAGAPQVVMSLWDIGDLSTKDIMVSFMNRVVNGMPVEFAIRSAMLDARDIGLPISSWAGFAMFGVPSL